MYLHKIWRVFLKVLIKILFFHFILKRIRSRFWNYFFIGFQIPEDTFYDSKDGNTRKMRIDVKQENGTPLRVPWLKYDPKLQTIFALPFDENGIGRYTFNIVATNSRGQSVLDKLEIFVRQYSGARLINHQFNVEFSGKIKPGWEWHVSRFENTSISVIKASY